METQPRLVDGPPRSIEAVIEFLTPPACRVELLGDLCEWYVSTPQYLMLACIHLPLKIFKHIRRSFNRMLFAAEVSALILAFGSASPVESLLVLTAVVLAVLTLCDAYCHPSEGTPKEAAVDAIAAAVVVVLSQAVLRIAAPQLALPAAVLVRGGAISLVMISAFRLLFRRTPNGLRLPPLHAAGTIQRANFMWVIAALTYLWTDTGAMPELIPHQDFFLAFVPIVVFALAFRLQKNDVFGLPGLKIPVPSQPDEDPWRGFESQCGLVTSRNALRRVPWSGGPLDLYPDGQLRCSMRTAETNRCARREEEKIMFSLVGDSRSMKALHRAIEKAAGADVDVLIAGESGTGKELVARAIHQNGGRAAGPFVAVNCGALNENILESELFGHERGAFTGADQQKKGKFELAHRGTLFLDEIGEVSPACQVKLLRALQNREVDRVGGTEPVPVDIRVIAATNRDLANEVAAGRFRQDLYYRLKVFSIRTPTLRERRDDIPLLARHFALKYGSGSSRRVTHVSLEVIAALQRHHWPGNVRELENVIHSAVVRSETDTVAIEDLPEDLLLTPASPHRSGVGNYYAIMEQTARQLVVTALAATGGSERRAAQLIGLHPKSIYRLRRRLGL